jgi:hypothetical protein
MRASIARVAPWLLAVFLGLSGAVHAAPQTGWWWNPNESGRGFFVESHDGITFIGAYFYDDDGHARWLVAGGQNDDSYNYTGQLYSLANGETLFGNYVAPSAPVYSGTVTVHFTDDTHGTLTWPGGTVQIERQIFGTGQPAFEPLAGWWWDPDAPGTGYSVEVQGSSLFIVGFMYDDSGRPVWYFSAGPKTSDTTYHGDVLQFANGQTMGGPYHPPGTPASVATLDIVFDDVDDATFTFTKSAGASVVVKANRSRHQRRQFVTLPRGYTGHMMAFTQYSVGGTARWQINIDSMTLIADDELAPLPLVHGVHGSTYDLRPTNLQITYNSNLAGCIGSGAATVPVPSAAVTLNVFSDHTYQMTLSMPGFSVSGTVQCPGDSPVPFTVPFPGMNVGDTTLRGAGATGATPIPDHDLAGRRASWQISVNSPYGSGPATGGVLWDFTPVWH